MPYIVMNLVVDSVKYQSEDGEAQRDDENFAYVAAWVTLVNQAKLFCTRTTGV
jgi:hypothetical protein